MRLVLGFVVFIGLTRVRGSDYPLDTKFLTLSNKEIHARKGLKKSQKILDHMGHEELAANLFRATQTEAKLRRDHVIGKDNANKLHFRVGQVVRETIRQLGGTMPEDLPTPEKSFQQLEREERKRLEGNTSDRKLPKK